MGGEGSIAGMIISLRNNANLLRKRTPVFKRRSEFIKARKVYRKNYGQDSGRKRLTKAEEEERRAKVLAEIKRDLLFRRIRFGVFMVAAFIGGYIIFTNLQHKVTFKEPEPIEMDLPPKSDSEPLDYDDFMAQGIALLQENRWFFAAGYFERALKARPGDKEAEYQLALVYCLLCHNEKKACSKAKSLVYELRLKHPTDTRFANLITRYLANKRLTTRN